MSGITLVNEILSCRRDFTYMQLEEGFDLRSNTGYFNAVQDYIHQQKAKLMSSPLDFSHASMRYFSAQGLVLPWVKAEGIDLTGAVLRRSKLYKCNLRNANLTEAIFGCEEISDASSLTSSDLEGACFRKADLRNVNFRYAVMRGANFSYSLLKGTDLMEADLQDAVGLEEALDLGYAKFDKTIVGVKEQRIIQQAQPSKLFVVKNDNLN